MATEQIFNGRVISEPGSYSQIKSGIKNPPLSLSYGNVLLIDTGKNKEFGGPAIKGENVQDKKVFEKSWDNLKDFREALVGGLFYGLAKNLFYPAGITTPITKGVSKLFYVRTASTFSAKGTFIFDQVSNEGGSFELKVLNEGEVGNGVLGDQILPKADYKVTTVGAIGNTHTIKVNENGTDYTLAIYSVAGGETVEEIALALTESINNNDSNSYFAKAVGDTITVTSRLPRGYELATDFHSFVPSYVTTGTAAGTSDSFFTGGANGTLLTKGYAIKMIAGPNANQTTPDKFQLEFYKGVFTGLDQNGNPYDGIEELETLPVKFLVTPEFVNLTELKSWMEKNSTFISHFTIQSFNINGTGIVDENDLSAHLKKYLFGEGYSVYNASYINDILDNIQDVDYTFILTDDYGVDSVEGAKSIINTEIQAFILTEAKEIKILAIGGGNDSNEFDATNGSLQLAKYFDCDQIFVVHGGYGKLKKSGVGYDYLDSIYKTASVLGRLAGLEPQVPITFKKIAFDVERHDLNETERKSALKAGVLHTKYDNDFGFFMVNQGISTLQNNDFMINEDATTYELSIKRIAAQLNKEIVYNSKMKLLRNESGVNRMVLSEVVLETFTKSFLQDKIATTIEDNLILGFEQITIETVGDTYKITYGFYPNLPINKLFFTGIMLDKNQS